MRTIVFLLLITSFLPTEAQTHYQKKLAPRNIGPAGMSGRITTIDVHPDNEQHIIVGSASGGAWQSKDGGISWAPMVDTLRTGSIGSIAFNPANGDEIWLGQGEGNPRNSSNMGEGVYLSRDGGQTWQSKGLEKTRSVHRILPDPNRPGTAYVGATGSIWGPNAERGVYKTTDYGDTWQHVLRVDDTTGVADMVMDPRNSNKLIVAMWEYGRKPWTFNSGGDGSGLYLTYDGGKTWEKRTHKDGLPKGDLGRIGLAISHSDPNIVYALIEAKENGLYKSIDGGRKWSLVSKKNIGNRPFYYADIFVDTENPNRLFNLYSLVDESIDGGKTFKTILPYGGYRAVHPDHHAFWQSTKDNDYMIEGNDGGLNISRDGGKTWRFVENLPLAQFYHINYDMATPYNVYGGMQDNGSWVGPSSVWRRGGIRNGDWQELYFGDGFDVVPVDERYGYAQSQQGNVGYYDRLTGKTQTVKPLHPEGEKLRFHWNAAIAKDPNNRCGVYFGSQFVHYSTDCGQSWTLLSPDLTTNDTLKQKQGESGGLTIDATGAENYTTIIAIEPSAVDRQLIWVGTDDGNLQLTRDGGKTWNNLAGRLPGARAGSWIPQIVAHPKRAGEALVIVNDYRRNDYRPMAYRTTNYGQSFERIVDENKVTGHALAIAQDPEEDRLLFLGTDYGLFVSFDGAASWEKWTEGFPSTPVRDLKIHPREHDLIIGTFGRAAWILDDIRPLREIARSKRAVFAQPLAVFPAPDATQASYRSYQGIRFAANAVYQGQNKRGGAPITVWVKPEKKEKKKMPAGKSKAAKDKSKKKKRGGKPTTEGEAKELYAPKTASNQSGEANSEPSNQSGEADPEPTKSKRSDKKIYVTIYDQQGDTVRNFSVKADTGLLKIYWDMGRNGYRFPSRRKVKEDADPPGGPYVLPGTYKAVVEHKEYRDSTNVTILPDPRMPFDRNAAQQKQEALLEFGELATKSSTAFQQLRDARETVALVNKTLVNLPDTTQANLKKHGKRMLDSLNRLEKLFMMPEGLKGIQRSSDNLNNDLYIVSRYLYAGDGAPNGNAVIALRLAEKRARSVFGEIETFFTGDWRDYQQAVLDARAELFGGYEPVRLE